MDLLLWRHAHARDAVLGEPDMDRPLTAKGERQAEKMARWLQRNLPKDALVLCSPALRTVQTVESFTKTYQLCEQIKPDSDAASLLAVSQWPHSPTAVLMVSHQPFLSEAVSQLLGFPPGFSLPFRKGSLWWLRNVHTPLSSLAQLLTVQDPEVF